MGGTLIGLLVGLAFGNGKLTVVFVLLGYIADTMLYAKKKETERQKKLQSAPPLGGFPIDELVFGLRAVAAVDAPVNDRERTVISRLLFEEFNLPREAKDRAGMLLRAPLPGDVSFAQVALRLNEASGSDSVLRQQFIIAFCKVAAADGPVNEFEERLVRMAADLFVLPDSWTSPLLDGLKGPDEGPRDEAKPPPADPYAVLGCARTDPESVIRREYRKLVMTYHPDRLTSKDLPEDMVRYAADRFREVQAAFEAIREERHFSRDDE